MFVIEIPLSGSQSLSLGFSPIRRVGESFIDDEYLREFEAKIWMSRNVLCGGIGNEYLQKRHKMSFIPMWF